MGATDQPDKSLYFAGPYGEQRDYPANPRGHFEPIVAVIVKAASTATEDGAQAKFLVTRDGTDGSTDLTVLHKAKGKAKNGTDYVELGGSIVIPAGSTSAKVKIKPTDNTIQDGMRTLTIKLNSRATSDYQIGATKKATISIRDND